MARRLLPVILTAALLALGFAASASAQPSGATDRAIGIDVDLPGGSGVNVEAENQQNVNGLINLGALHA